MWRKPIWSDLNRGHSGLLFWKFSWGLWIYSKSQVLDKFQVLSWTLSDWMKMLVYSRTVRHIYVQWNMWTMTALDAFISGLWRDATLAPMLSASNWQLRRIMPHKHWHGLKGDFVSPNTHGHALNSQCRQCYGGINAEMSIPSNSLWYSYR